ncbi:probable DNA replication complex GINS protein PSF2 isoform X1 [Neodiprion pinetum]|uniref:DNA replication complex GINS protein PSF2 n=1 Tax=Neodiprion lecontei TaxID=441921 RepID=A0A6J0BWC6_NEOLC|nr:probable DNA replication complex GINS protein PSF2 isoform X1 [Neodiprion lecontei]XP_046425969.1 probable DNA replication complex GINS protein PSF2 [Neodiprion fabricii]XP_046485613.1 probable DNA replication complex GINS protein PSF2 isoform X1 [Neodiprion pinetum]XP_046619711.1 probable DNA replication complex GINS protein PSF2 isoform X1 [Neodiprion virginianus]
MDPNEVEFLGEKQLVTIIPSFTFNQIHLISGSIGPFRAGLPTQVPIWLAVNLKQQQKCRIVGQEWMDAKLLIDVKDEEKTSKFFTKMPSDHYMDETLMLLGVAPEDIPQAEEIRTIVKDLWDIRMSKLRTSVDAFMKSDSAFAKLDHLTPMEINCIRPSLPHALDQRDRIQTCGSRPRDSQDTQRS